MIDFHDHSLSDTPFQNIKEKFDNKYKGEQILELAQG